MMRLGLFIAIALGLGPASAQAQAQSTGAGSGSPAPVVRQSNVRLTEEDRHVIKEIVLKERPGQEPPASISLDVGQPVTSDIKTMPFPDSVTDKVPQMRPFAYVVKAEKIFVVDPKDSRIIEVIQ